MYVLGLDGGGTKTDVLLLPYEKKGGEKQNEQEEWLLRFATGGINYNSFSKEEIRTHVGRIRDNLTESGYMLRECAGVGIGAAGISNPEAAPFLEEVFHLCGFTCPIRIVGDDEAALIGGLGTEPGLLLIAGTGSVCLGQDQMGRMFRAGGFGHLIDDGGSAYAIACDMLRAIVRAQDGRGPETMLTEAVFSSLEISSVQELIAFLYAEKTGKKEIAALASLLTEDMIHKDAAARDITRKAAGELAELTATVAARLGAGREVPLLFEGSVLLKNQSVREALAAELEDRRIPVCVSDKKADAAYGAASMMRTAGAKRVPLARSNGADEVHSV